MPWDESLVNSLVYDRPDPSEGRVLSYVSAINEALSIALAEDPAVFVLGQGVDDPSAMFGTTRGLQERFGRDRVFDTPLSEEAMMGVSIGAWAGLPLEAVGVWIAVTYATVIVFEILKLWLASGKTAKKAFVGR